MAESIWESQNVEKEGDKRVVLKKSFGKEIIIKLKIAIRGDGKSPDRR